MIEIKNLRKVYPNDLSKRKVLDGLNLEVGESQSLAIMGESGSGKSTLLNILGAVDSDYEGSVIIAGQDLSIMSEDDLADFRKNEIGFIFQYHYFLPQYNLLENVLIPSLASKKNLQNRAKDLLEKVGLKDKFKQYPNELSGGELQRATLARALINSPKILLADEATGALDPKNAQGVLELINSIEGLVKIFVTHSNIVASAMEKKLVLKDGVLLECI